MLAALLIAADLTTSLSVSDRTEVRLRMPGDAAAASLDVETAPEARFEIASRRARFMLSYAPRLTVWDTIGAPQLSIFHAGDARFEWRGRRARLFVDQAGSYGGVSLASSPPAPASPFVRGPDGRLVHVDPIPDARVLQLLSTTTTLGSHLEGRRWTLDTAAGYQLSGGATAGARALLPLSQGPFGEATASFAVTRTDHLATRLSASEAAFSSGPESLLLEVDESYRHLWSRTTETRLTVGVAEARVRASANAAHTFETHPVVEAAFERGRDADARLRVLGRVRVGPTVDRLTGLVDERLDGSLAASHRFRLFTASALASASRSLSTSGPSAASLFAGELGVAWGPTRSVAIDAGARAFWQRLDLTGATLVQGTLFVGVTLRAPKVRL